jgi:hypothetical protein
LVSRLARDNAVADLVGALGKLNVPSCLNVIIDWDAGVVQRIEQGMSQVGPFPLASAASSAFGLSMATTIPEPCNFGKGVQ